MSSHQQTLTVVSWFTQIAFSIGRFDLNVASYCCSSCDYTIDPLKLNNLVSEGYWPGTVVNTQYVFTQDVLRKWDLLQKRLPGSSESGFLRSLEDFSISRGRVGGIMQGYRMVLNILFFYIKLKKSLYMWWFNFIFGLQFLKPVWFLLPFVSDYDNEHETIKKNQTCLLSRGLSCYPHTKANRKTKLYQGLTCNRNI